MCGIIGILGKQDVAPLIVEGLKRLEYRGYDSAGVATIEDGKLDRRRAPGKLAALTQRADFEPLPRRDRHRPHALGDPWRGERRQRPSARDASASRLFTTASSRISPTLRDELKAKGYISHPRPTPKSARSSSPIIFKPKTCRQGRFRQSARAHQGRLRARNHLHRRGRPDDRRAARQPTRRRPRRRRDVRRLRRLRARPLHQSRHLSRGRRLGVITRKGFEIYDAKGAKAVTRRNDFDPPPTPSSTRTATAISWPRRFIEQPEVIAHTLSRYHRRRDGTVRAAGGPFDFAKLDRLTISACGTAYYAGLVSKYWFETWAQLLSKSMSHRNFAIATFPTRRRRRLVCFAVRRNGRHARGASRREGAWARRSPQSSMSLSSSIARESDVIFPMAAGPEIGVASTKAFTCQLAALAAFAVAAGRAARVPSEAQEKRDRACAAGNAAPRRRSAEAIARDRSDRPRNRQGARPLYVGRGVSFPLAMEGALKLKEISYIHAEGYAAGELKHGPIALIDENVPVIVIAPSDKLFEKTISNMHEVMARDGKAILMSDAKGNQTRRSRPLRLDRGSRDPPPSFAHRLRRAHSTPRLLHGDDQGHGCRPAAQSREVRHR